MKEEKTGSNPHLSPENATQSSRGFSRRVDTEAVRNALKKQKKYTRIGGAVIIPAPLIGFLIYGAVSDSLDMGRAFLYGLAVSAVFALTTLIATIRQKSERPFVGTVVRKKREIQARDTEDSGGRSKDRWLIYFDCEDGKRRKKEVSRTIYTYLKEGDRIRYLPQFPQPYEKYDKSGDGEVLCMFCSRRVGLDKNTCPFCKNPLIK